MTTLLDLPATGRPFRLPGATTGTETYEQTDVILAYCRRRRRGLHRLDRLVRYLVRYQGWNHTDAIVAVALAVFDSRRLFSFACGARGDIWLTYARESDWRRGDRANATA